jgi:hypothetical protein
MGEVTNFARFYQAFNRMPYSGDREELKKQIVLQYTWNRTDSLREMSMKEYLECCAGLEKLIGKEPEAAQREGNMTRAERETLRANRSQALHWMQKLGIDTADWDCVNRFCKNPRIAGKSFREITTLELVKLVNKLRAIDRKGGLRIVEEKRREGMAVRYNITAPCGEA